MADDKEPQTAGLEETVRSHLNGRTDSGYAIAKKAGISRQQFYRFVRGERGLTLDSLDKLCYVLGLALFPVVNVEAFRAEYEAKNKAKREEIDARMRAKKDEVEAREKAKREEMEPRRRARRAKGE